MHPIMVSQTTVTAVKFSARSWNSVLFLQLSQTQQEFNDDKITSHM